MNNRLSIPEIAGLIAEQNGIEKKKTERFLKELVAIIRDVVFDEKIIKIKGIGTFKIVEVQDRESVDVNTGNRILIPGHYKFSFIPDKELKDEVNKPFSFFETVEISDHISTADMEHREEAEETTENTVTSENTGRPLSEPEIKEPEQPDTTPVEEPEKEQEPVVVQEPADIVEESKEIKTGTVNEQPQEEETPVSRNENETEEPVSTVVEPEPEKRPGFFIPGNGNNINTPPTIQPEPKSGKAKIWWSVAIILVLFAGSGIFFFQRYPVNAWNTAKTDINTVADSILDNIINEMLVEPDSLNFENGEAGLAFTGDTADSTVSNPAASPEQTEEENENTATSDEIIATVNIKAGSRLTLIALEYYGNKVFWVYLYEHNKNLIKDPNNVPIGTEIAIPAPELYNINPNSKASIEKAALLQSQILSTF